MPYLLALYHFDAQVVAKYFFAKSYQAPISGYKSALHFAAGSDKCHSQANVI